MNAKVVENAADKCQGQLEITFDKSRNVLLDFAIFCDILRLRWKMKDAVMVFTSKSLETMRLEGGTGNWAAKEERLKHSKWIIATRNQKSNWAQGEEPHGSAFLIGRVSGVKPAPAPEENRFVIGFDRYAELHIPNAWTNNRNPVAYTSLDALGIDAERLEWKPFEIQEDGFPKDASNKPRIVIDQARSMIARALSIDPEAVKITVDF